MNFNHVSYYLFLQNTLEGLGWTGLLDPTAVPDPAGPAGPAGSAGPVGPAAVPGPEDYRNSFVGSSLIIPTKLTSTFSDW